MADNDPLILVYKKRLKLNKNQKAIVNHLSRNSKAIFNTSVYYGRSILNQEGSQYELYKQKITEYNNRLRQIRHDTYNNKIANYKKIKKDNNEEIDEKELEDIKITKDIPIDKFNGNGLANFMRENYKNYDFMASHSSQQVIFKVNNCFSSYFSLLKKGIKANPPDFLPKKGRFNILFTKNIFKLEEIHKRKTQYNLRLTLGEYIQKNYIEITGDKNLGTIDNKKYFNLNKLINSPKGKSKKDYCKYHNKYVHKNDLINGMYLNLSVPRFIKDYNVNEVEIKPIKNGLEYELIIKYKINQSNIDKTEEKTASIDLGVNNLITSFTIDENPFIINGKPLKSINSFYCCQIGTLQKNRDLRINKLQDKNTSKNTINKIKYLYDKKIRILYEKRNKKISTMMHQITSFYTKYCVANGIKNVVCGYNKGWKVKVKLGKKYNGVFYSIPFRTLINMLKYKLNLNGIHFNTIEEHHTSKCDSLTNESIEHHEKYRGKRIKRGLFRSLLGETEINCDVNGAINIMRKDKGYERAKGIEFTDMLWDRLSQIKTVNKITVGQKYSAKILSG